MRYLFFFLYVMGALLGIWGTVSAQELPDTTAVSDLKRHNPYDLTKAAPVDSSDVYRSGANYLFSLPRYLWGALVYPVGELAIYAEHAKLVAKYYSWFINEEGTFGVLPQVQIGGETGTGGGVRVFHTNVAGKGKLFNGFYVYSGGRGQMGEGVYLDPRFWEDHFHLKVEGQYLRTRHEGATINAALPDDSGRLFRLDGGDVDLTLGWRRHSGRLAPFLNNVQFLGRIGMGRRDFRVWSGQVVPLNHGGATPEAELLNGLGREYNLFRFGGKVVYDDRDYKHPTQTLSHPLNYKLPGRVVVQAEDGLYYYFRDLGYPERGGLFALEAEAVTGSSDIRFYRIVAEMQRYVTLFWRDRILAVRTRVEKLRRLGGGYVPYTELVRLGGGTEMRGYRRGYLLGQGSLVINVEYRYPIWDTWNAFIFLDEGQVFDHFNQITLDRFRTSWGGGISFRTEFGLLGKFQVGHSAVERVLVGFTLAQDF